MAGEAAPDLKVRVGRHVELDLRYESGESERLGLDVVEDRAADFARGFLGASTALARAIYDRQAGETVYYQADGRVRVRILSVAAAWSGSPQDLSARRAEATRSAIRKSDQTNAVLFASSFSGKWGDYDPNAVEQDEEQPE